MHISYFLVAVIKHHIQRELKKEFILVMVSEWESIMAVEARLQAEQETER